MVSMEIILKLVFLKVRRCCRLRGCFQCRRGLPRGRAEGSSDRSRIQTNLPPARTLSRGWGRPTLCPSFLLGSHSPGLHSTAHSWHPGLLPLPPSSSSSLEQRMLCRGNSQASAGSRGTVPGPTRRPPRILPVSPRSSPLRPFWRVGRFVLNPRCIIIP